MYKKRIYYIIVHALLLIVFTAICEIGDVSSINWQLDKTVPAPILVPLGGYFSNQRLLTIKVDKLTDNSNIIIKYTDDGSDPKISPSTKIYSSPFLINRSVFIQAISENENGNYSKLASANFIKIFRISKPQISTVENGKYLKIFLPDSQASVGATLYYTLDGRDPAIFGHRYIKPLLIDPSVLLKCIAVNKNGKYLNSPMVTYTFDSTSIFKGENYSISDADISVEDAGAVGYFRVKFETTLTSAKSSDQEFIFTLDGSDPVIGSVLWNHRSFIVKAPAYIKVRTLRAGLSLGKIVEKKIVPPQLPLPIADIPSGMQFANSLLVNLSIGKHIKGPVEILYTTNGDDPYENGIAYSGSPIEIRASCTVRSIAQAPGYTSSPESKFDYFHIIEIKNCYYQDKDRDGFVESATLLLSSQATSLPAIILFKDPNSRKSVTITKTSMQLSDSGDSIFVNFEQPLTIGEEFQSGHYGRVSTLGEYSTASFLVSPNPQKNRNKTGNISKRILKPYVIATPFTPDLTELPDQIRELASFSVEFGTAVMINPKRPSKGYGILFDALGNIVMARQEMIEDSSSGALYLIWDGKNRFGKNVVAGNYLAIISIEEKLSGNTSSFKAFLTVSY